MTAYGFAGHIGVARETAWGTAVAATDYFEAMSESLSESVDRFPISNIVGRFSEPDDMAGISRFAGDIVWSANPQALGLILASTFGVQSNSEVVSGFLHQHRFTLQNSDNAANNPLPPLTFEVFRDVTSSQQYRGCQISRLQFSAAPNQDLRVTASVLARNFNHIVKTTPTFPGSPVTPFAFDTCSLSLGGAGTALVEAFTLSIDNQLEGIPTLDSSSVIAKIRRTGPQIVRLTGSLAFENITDYLRFRNQTEVVFQAHFLRANSFSLFFDVPRFVYTTFPLGMGDRGRQVVGFDGIARYHTGSLNAIRIQLTNTTSGFA